MTAEEMFKEQAEYDYKNSGSFAATPFKLDGIPFVRRLAIYEIMEKFAKQQSIEFCQEVLDNIEINGVKLPDIKKVDAKRLYEIYEQSKSTNV